MTANESKPITASSRGLFRALPLRLRRKIRMDMTEAHPLPFSGPPTRCGTCERELAEDSFFADAALPSGLWSYLCIACFLEAGAPVGYGRGQLYWLQPSSGRWLLLNTGESHDNHEDE